MAVRELAFEVVQGDLWRFGVTIEDLDLTPFEVAGATASDYGVAPIDVLTEGDGIDVDDPVNGHFFVVQPLTTAKYAAGRYVYDIEVKQGIDIKTVVRGTITVLPEVTSSP